MKILLYKPDSPTAFRKYNDPYEVLIPVGTDKVFIVNTALKDADINPVVAKFKLVRKQNPIWTDETKIYSEIMVKLQVEDLKK